jgi:hypothetical protein
MRRFWNRIREQIGEELGVEFFICVEQALDQNARS